MSRSYNKVTKALNSEPLKNQPQVKNASVDPVAAVTNNRDSVIIDTEMELKAVLGNKNDPNDTPEELTENRFKL